MDRGAWQATVIEVTKRQTRLSNSLSLSLSLSHTHTHTQSKRTRWRQKMMCLDSFFNSVDVILSKLPEMVKDREARHAAVHGVA